jgi:hypothetical protein
MVELGTLAVLSRRRQPRIEQSASLHLPAARKLAVTGEHRHTKLLWYATVGPIRPRSPGTHQSRQAARYWDSGLGLLVAFLEALVTSTLAPL